MAVEGREGQVLGIWEDIPEGYFEGLEGRVLDRIEGESVKGKRRKWWMYGGVVGMLIVLLVVGISVYGGWWGASSVGDDDDFYEWVYVGDHSYFVYGEDDEEVNQAQSLEVEMGDEAILGYLQGYSSEVGLYLYELDKQKE